MKRWMAGIAGLLICLSAQAGDVWVVRGGSGTVLHDCLGLRWVADVILHNRTSSEAVVRTIHVSNGGDSSANTAALQPHTSATASSLGVGGTANSSLWVAKLDVPTNLVTEGRLESFDVALCNPGQPPPAVPNGKIALPVFTSLTPAGAEQVHFGTDLGGQAVRLNVAVYNAATVPAMATIVVTQPMCANVAVTKIALVPADSIVQIAIPEVRACTAAGGWASYVTVVVDQPSFSFVSTIANGTTPAATHTVTP
jgi:hypothetical protein